MSCTVRKSYRQIDFRALSEEPITEDQAIEAQITAGYMPQGYGFYDFKVSMRGDYYEATWNCFASAD